MWASWAIQSPLNASLRNATAIPTAASVRPRRTSGHGFTWSPCPVLPVALARRVVELEEGACARRHHGLNEVPRRSPLGLDEEDSAETVQAGCVPRRLASFVGARPAVRVDQQAAEPLGRALCLWFLALLGVACRACRWPLGGRCAPRRPRPSTSRTFVRSSAGFGAWPPRASTCRPRASTATRRASPTAAFRRR